MKTALKLDEAGIFLIGVFLFSMLDYSWWLFPVLFLLPDLSMAGYLAGEKAGAFCYNLFHHQATAAAFYITGYFAGLSWLQLAGVILLSHAALDRMMGYGLKYADSFKHTHLGWLDGRKGDVKEVR